VVFIDQIHTDAVPEIKAYFQSRMDQLKKEEEGGGGIEQCIIADPVGNTLDPLSSGCACTHTNIQDRKMVAGYTWTPPPPSDTDKMVMVWMGSMDAPALYQLQITYNTTDWLVYDTMNDRLHGGVNEEGDEPSSSSSYLIDEVTKTLRRRYFLVEKARNANIIGIVMGTLGVAGYRQVLTVLKKAVAKAGKKSYTFLMGKPSPAKLANFPEVDVFVLVADPQGQIMDCKEFLAPIITPHEAMIAFTGKEWDAASYRLDFQDLLIQADDTRSDTANVQPGPRFSLIDGSHHIDNEEEEEEGEEEEDRSKDDIQGNALAVYAQRALQVTTTVKGGGDMTRIVPTSAAEYMVYKRTWKGVDAPILTGAEEKEVVGAVEGRSGRARGYAEEKGGGK
jgi:diphthamide biosynthesis protein 2